LNIDENSPNIDLTIKTEKMTFGEIMPII